MSPVESPTTSIPSSLTLPNGLTISDPYGRLLRFSKEEYDYYDAIPDLEPDRIMPIDILATWSVNSNLYKVQPQVKVKDPATEMRTVHRELAQRVDSILPSVPADADLLTFDPDLLLLEKLLTHAIEVRKVGVSVATKVLHRKRRNFIPILDAVIMRNFLERSEIGALRSPTYWHDDELHIALALKAVEMFRASLESCHETIETLRQALAMANYSLTPVRILEILIWAQRRRLHER
jgi:hypothetical protein